jgi:hypothetical protein
MSDGRSPSGRRGLIVSVRYVTQERVERTAREIARGATRMLDVASPWVEPLPVQKLLAEVLPAAREGALQIRLVYRVAEENDLRITDLAALEWLAAEGVQIRYSRRLHAKLVIADRRRALVGSSNLTRRAGYGYRERPEWRNEEAGVLLEDESAAEEAAAHFDGIWAAAEEIVPALLGVVMDFPSVREFRFVAIREVSAGQLVTASSDARTTVVGEVAEVTAYNRSFPQMTEEMFVTQGLGGVAGRRVTVPDLPTLFSHPVKDHGFLVAKTYFHPESAFQIARVRVLRELRSARPGAAVAPIAPGSDVLAPDPGTLRRLLGDGDLQLGRMQRHPDVGVWLRRHEILSRHLAVLGMTGSGKSNAVKHLLSAIVAPGDVRAFVVDTHGEYRDAAGDSGVPTVPIDVSIPDRIDLLDWDMVKERFSIGTLTAAIKKGLRDAGRQTSDPAAFATALSGSSNDTLQDIAAAVAAEPEGYCVGKEEARVVAADGGDGEVELDAPGVYVLDLRETETFEVRAKKCAVLASRVFADAKRSRGGRPAVLVIDEAHNYVPERTTGYMAEAARHGSLGAVTTLAVERRKFNVGLIVISQRPSRIAKDVLAQANSQLVFRLANLEDLQYVRESFEAAGEMFMADLPHLDTGVCLCAGTMVAMPVRCDVPLFAPRHRFMLGAVSLPRDRTPLARAVEAVLPEAAVVADAEEHTVFSGPRAEVTLRAVDGAYALDVDSADPTLAERVRASVAAVLRGSDEVEGDT